MDGSLLDDLAVAATPATIEADVAGWRARIAPDLPFRRANVAIPPPEAAADEPACAAAVEQLRAWYQRHDARLIIQVSSALAGWERLDALLERAGLEIEAPVHLMVAGATPTAPANDMASGLPAVAVRQGIDPAWATGPRPAAYARMLAPMGDRVLTASCAVDGKVAGVGLGVVDRGWLGIFAMATEPEYRRQGIATAVVRALRSSAAAMGADQAYLQVETDNVGAIALYERLGFVRHHGYHYRSEWLDPERGC